jgi:hypothetical protein
MAYVGPWRVVNSLTTLRLQLDAAFPGRSHASDGTIADDAHSTTSDHYPHRYAVLGSTPVVTAFDGTHDPAHGCYNRRVCEAIRVSRDPRVKYVISNGELYSSYSTSSRRAWEWGPYTGSSDPHRTHFHISVLPTALADSTAPWAIGVEDMTPEQDLRLKQVAAVVRADRTLWAADRAAFLAAGGDPAVWDVDGGMGANAASVLLAKLAADVAELKARPPAQVSAAELAAALIADPAFAKLLQDAAFHGAQRAETE